jgi:triosephosphate isomerase
VCLLQTLKQLLSLQRVLYQGGCKTALKRIGAFTGEISADMLAEMGVEYVIIGHSEEDSIFAETDITVNREQRLLCCRLKGNPRVGEMLAEREDGITEDVVELQTVAAFTGISEADAKNLLLLRACMGYRHRQDSF